MNVVHKVILNYVNFMSATGLAKYRILLTGQKKASSGRRNKEI